MYKFDVFNTANQCLRLFKKRRRISDIENTDLFINQSSQSNKHLFI